MTAPNAQSLDASGQVPAPAGRLAARLRIFVESPRLPYKLALIGFLFGIPSLFIGWQMDDYAQRALLLGVPTENALFQSRYEIFTLADGKPESALMMMDEGFAPWWTYERVVLSFLRPLTVLTHDFDYHVFSGPTPMHVHSMLWFAAMVFAVAVLYRRTMQPVWIAGLAALLYAIDDARGFPLVWLANRNALTSGLFGVLALIAHDRWRRDGWRAGGAVGPALLLLSLFSAEAGIGTCAYLFAYQVCADRGDIKRRALGLLPYVLAGGVWFAVYRAGDYGAYGNYFYLDPIREAGAYLRVLPERFLMLLLGQWGLPPSSFYIFLGPGAAKAVAVFAALFLAVIALLLAPIVREDRMNRFWLVGMLLSLLPVAATIPHDRNLTFAGLGGFALLAQLFARLWEAKPVGAPKPRWARAIGIYMVAVHFVFAPVLLLGSSSALASLDPYSATAFAQVEIAAPARDKTAFFLNPPVPFGVGYFKSMRDAMGLPYPGRTLSLATGTQSISIERTDERTLVVRPEIGYLPPPGYMPEGSTESSAVGMQNVFRVMDLVFRSPDYPMALGHTVELHDVTIEVTKLREDDGRAAEATFRFKQPLESADYIWIEWADGKYTTTQPPGVGETVVFPAI